MLKLVPSDYPPNKEVYKYFAEKYGRKESAIRNWFYAQKNGTIINQTQQERSKQQIEQNQQLAETLENHFKQDLFPSDEEIQAISDEVNMSFSRVKSSLDNYRLLFEKKIGKEQFQKRIDAGDFTAFED